MTDAQHPPARTGGRPKKDPVLLRSARLQVNFTPVEREALTLRAAALGLALQDFVRAAALGTIATMRPVATVDPAALAEVHRLGVNLNQLTKAANANRLDAAMVRDLADTLDQIRAIVGRLSPQ